MKIVSRFLLISLPLLTVVSLQEALAGSCGSRGCNVIAVPQTGQRAPATASASHAFTAIGGSRVADINLSQEALAVINAGGKEEPLPKGFMSAADRAKLIARQQPLYGWPEDEIGRPLRTQSHYSTATRALRSSRGSTERRAQAKPVKPATAVNVAIVAKAKSQTERQFPNPSTR